MSNLGDYEILTVKLIFRKGNIEPHLRKLCSSESVVTSEDAHVVKTQCPLCIIAAWEEGWGYGRIPAPCPQQFPQQPLIEWACCPSTCIKDPSGT